MSSATLSVSRDCDCANHFAADGNYTPYPGAETMQCGENDVEELDAIQTKCGNTVQLLCAGSVYLLLNGQNVGHCPYLPSVWSAAYLPCQCGDTIMATVFNVYQKPGRPGTGPGVFCGKQEIGLVNVDFGDGVFVRTAMVLPTGIAMGEINRNFPTRIVGLKRH